MNLDTIEEIIDNPKIYKIIKSEMPTILTKSEYAIICLRYGVNGNLPLTRKEVSEKIDLSPSAVANIERRALTKIRNRIKELCFIKK